jgi:hypothetical protein
MPMSDKQLKAKGFVPVSQRAELVGGGHKPPATCVPNDYAQLPPQVQAKYDPRPENNGRMMVHRLRG